MYGGSSKRGGRGGGGGSGSRRSSLPPPPPVHRPTPASRLSLGPSNNPRNNRPGPINAKSLTASNPGVEETFSLIPGNSPLAFAMIIRLVPDLVDEIRRIEAQGGTARIKFGSIANNNDGNVIDVGGKEFRFTWSREFGDLCDIYEERQGGVDGNGLLVESGCAWRKVNVQRILDESTTNHVKMLSEEAERKSKARKAIVLDHENPAAKSQIKQLAAVESTPWRNFKQKKQPPYKKRKVEPNPGSGFPKSTYKPALSSAAIAKGRLSSPLPSPPEQSGAPASPYGTGSITKHNVGTEDYIPTQMKNKENAASSENEIPAKATSALWETTGRKGNLGAKPMDLQSMLVDLLIQNSKGMSLKALEKAVGSTIPNSAKKIEPIIKKIANFQAPGRYILKPGMESEKFKKHSSESGSSPEDNQQQAHAPEDNCAQRPDPEPRFAEKDSTIRPRPDLFGEKKVSDISEGHAGSSSDSGSDSDSESDSSDSGSDSASRSRSRSRSRSPVGSGTGSSSDSESDASSNSKEGSDEDVDIMTSDDDKEPQHKLQADEPGLLASPDHWRSVLNGIDEKLDGNKSAAVDIEGHESDAIEIEDHESDAIEIDKDLAGDEKDIKITKNDSLVSSKEGEKPVQGAESTFHDHDMIQERQTFIGNLFDDDDNMVRDNFRHEQSDSSERTSKSKSKRDLDVKSFDSKSERVKRLKTESLSLVPTSKGRDIQFSGSPHDKHNEDMYKGPAIQVMDRADKQASDFGSERLYNQAISGKSNPDFQRPGRRSSDQNARLKALEDASSRSKRAEGSGTSCKFPEKGSYVHEAISIQREKASRDTQNEDNILKEQKVPRNSKEGGSGGRHSAPFDSHYRKPGEAFGRPKDAGQISNSNFGFSPKDTNRVDMEKYPVVSGRGLHRELSDLELGELHINKGKSIGKVSLDSGKPSPNLSAGVKRSPERRVSDLTRLNYKAMQSQPQHVSSVDNLDVGSGFSKLADSSSRLRPNETVAKLGNSMEGYGESHKKAPLTAQKASRI
ncbi:hypothetical protein OIU78_014515 [Salix suchowensis]|nr:hypothetical protein OIU78_014515 [Salix suchowensis]